MWNMLQRDLLCGLPFVLDMVPFTAMLIRGH